LTEIPEHLLQRTRSRRSALGLGGGDDGAAADAGGGSAPAAAGGGAVAAAPAGKVPTADFATSAKSRPAAKAPAPHVVAATTRGRIPIWAMPMLAFLPVWAVLYVGTLSEADLGGMTALELGSEVYGAQGCAGCHGAGGGGGAGPAFTNGAVLTTFPDPADHIRWVQLGAKGWKTEFGPTYGAQGKPAQNMPSFDSLEMPELLSVVRHERENFGGEIFDPEVWAPILEQMVEAGELDAEFAEHFLADEDVVSGGAPGH
jgi:hypothetical protein